MSYKPNYVLSCVVGFIFFPKKTMPVNRNALIRYKTIDACLRNRLKNGRLKPHQTQSVIDFEKK